MISVHAPLRARAFWCVVVNGVRLSRSIAHPPRTQGSRSDRAKGVIPANRGWALDTITAIGFAAVRSATAGAVQ
jgi:hypothetical protein